MSIGQGTSGKLSAYLIRDGGSSLFIFCGKDMIHRARKKKALFNNKGQNLSRYCYMAEPTPESVLWIPVWSFHCVMVLSLCSSGFLMVLVPWLDLCLTMWPWESLFSFSSLVNNSTD